MYSKNLHVLVMRHAYALGNPVSRDPFDSPGGSPPKVHDSNDIPHGSNLTPEEKFLITGRKAYPIDY